MNTQEQRSFIIAGHTVLFPYQPYPSQFAMMDRVIKAISKKENALLESATGTGKSLALLCGSLAWQTAEKERMRREQTTSNITNFINQPTTKFTSQSTTNFATTTTTTTQSTNSGQSQSNFTFQSQIKQTQPSHESPQSQETQQSQTMQTSQKTQSTQSQSTQQTQSQEEEDSLAILHEFDMFENFFEKGNDVTSSQSTTLKMKQFIQESGETHSPPLTPTQTRKTEIDTPLTTSPKLEGKNPNLEETGNLQKASTILSPKNIDDKILAEAEAQNANKEPKTNTEHKADKEHSTEAKPTKENQTNKEIKKSKKEIRISDNGDDDFLPTPIFKPTKKRKEKKQPNKPTPHSKKTKKTPQLPLSPSTPPFTPPPPSSSFSSSKKAKESSPPSSSSFVKPPTIFFGTRTHAQVTQLIAELERTSYRPKMSVLAARDHYCLHPVVSRHPHKTAECKKMVALESCQFDKGTRKIMKSEALVGQVWDIEDLVKMGRRLTSCPYYAARGIAKTAEIVFCPYNYIIDPGIRETLGIDLEGAAVIFDEAHNIEDAMMNASSGDFELEDLNNELLFQLTKLSKIPGFDAYTPIQRMVAGLVEWMTEGIKALTPTDFETHTNFWSGDDLVEVLARAGVTLETIPILVESVAAIEELSGTLEKHAGLTAKALSVLLDLVKVLRLLYSEELRFSSDFRVVIQKVSRHEKGRSFWTHSLGIWCLSPRVAYRGLMPARSIILTSGTLSPMESYASELGTKFEWRAELGHVIDTNRQIWVASIARGPNGQLINTTFQNADSFSVQDALGETICTLLGCIPGGVLCFFPSYSLLERLITRWQTTGMWQQLQKVKEVFAESRGSSSDFSGVLAAYYKAAASPRGAVLLAVCRGKASEGIDFTDQFARGVIVVGIPYPNVKELRILLKRNYNDQYATENGLLNGQKWYQLQAFRALNQALGRCIRHRHDYGSIILIDNRFTEEAVISKLSKWVRGNVRKENDLQQAALSLRSFFSSHSSSPPSF